MDKKYTRPGAETVKECGECGTAWKKSWLNAGANDNECPFCGKKYKKEVSIKLPKIRNQKLTPAEIKRIKWWARIDAAYKLADLYIFENESTPLSGSKYATSDGRRGYEPDMTAIKKLRAANNANIVRYNAKKFHTLFEISRFEVFQKQNTHNSAKRVSKKDH